MGPTYREKPFERLLVLGYLRPGTPPHIPRRRHALRPPRKPEKFGIILNR